MMHTMPQIGRGQYGANETEVRQHGYREHQN
ncbi:hypothetical protein BGLA2_700029 [Burkholderia gladioli]|nr:hypothetical protein BGLA2_700029 [Burkholderia gladioli]